MIEPYWWWTEEERALAKEVDQFCDDNIELAERAHLEKRFPWEVMKRVGEKYMGAGVPKEYGGMGLGGTGSCIVAEALGRLYAVGHVFVVSMLGGLHQLIIYGTEEQKKKYLTQIAEGNVLGAVMITEPFAGSDAANVYTSAKKDGDNWIINGKKRMITAAGAAGRYFAYIKTSDDPADRKAYKHLTAFVLDRGMKGFTLEKINDLIGFDNVPNGYLNMEDVEVPDANRVGEVGSGWMVMMSGLNFERLIAGAVLGGGLGDIIKMLGHYMERRVQFNSQVKRFTNLQFNLAEIIQKYYIARLICYHSAYLLDHSKELKLTEFETGTWASVAKIYCTEAARDVGQTAVQITGGDGLTRFYPAERLVRESKIGEIVAGTTEVNKMIIYRMSGQKRGFLELTHYFKLHEDLGVPVLTNQPSHWEGTEVTKENVLKVLGEDFRINPGLYMTIDDIKQRMAGRKKAVITALEELEQDGLIVTHKGRDGKIIMGKANFVGPRKAYPKEFYQYYPDWVKEDEFLMGMTKY